MDYCVISVMTTTIRLANEYVTTHVITLHLAHDLRSVIMVWQSVQLINDTLGQSQTLFGNSGTSFILQKWIWKSFICASLIMCKRILWLSSWSVINYTKYSNVYLHVFALLCMAIPESQLRLTCIRENIYETMKILKIILAIEFFSVSYKKS